MKKLSILLIILILFCSCAGVKTKPDKHIATTIVLDTYCTFPEKSPNDVHKESEEYEMKFAKRLQGIIQSNDPRIHIMLPDEFRKRMFNGKNFKNTPRSYEDLLFLAYDKKSYKKLEEENVQFIMSLKVRHVTKPTETHLYFPDVLWGIGRHWKSIIKLDAHVLDVKNPEEPGIFSEEEDGLSFYGTMFILIIPVPYGWHPFFKNCMAFDRLATQVTKFIEERLKLEPLPPPKSIEGPIYDY